MASYRTEEGKFCSMMSDLYLKVAMSQSATWDGVNKKHRHYVLNFLVSLASRTVATRRPRRLASHRCVR
ncbi:Dicer-like protein 1 [Fusarium oxysporum f. sp. albedinis]|nr:Dicer-like protein 1 [Fusarium oxysporum f. sp. albedinis]